MSELRERVARSIATSDDQPLRGSLRRRGYIPTQQWESFSPMMQAVYLNNADAAITAVIEALAAEADDHDRRYQRSESRYAVVEPDSFLVEFDEQGPFNISPSVALWLRSHLDAGRDGEAG